jgi:CRISPR-associated protein Csb2
VIALEVELLTGGYRAALPDGLQAEWPPHPERVYSALVQAWGDGGNDGAERQALEWLERQQPPSIEASGPDHVAFRDAPTVFVPPNDAKGSDLEALPERRRRQARSFQVAVPEEPLVRFSWSGEPPDVVRASLRALAGRVASLGHSSSLVRCHLQEDVNPRLDRCWVPGDDAALSLRMTYEGRLGDLERWFHGERGSPERPRSRTSVGYQAPTPLQGKLRASDFGDSERWFVFEDSGRNDSFRPDMLAFAVVARRLRDAMMKAGPQPVPEIISGHAPGDTPSTSPHLAIVPLLNAGWPHASGDLLGLAIVVPRRSDDAALAAVKGALAKLLRYEEEAGAGQLRINLFGDRRWIIDRAIAPSRASLRPGRWCAASRIWASVTPMMLDRFPKEGDPAEEARLVASACAAIGLPEPMEVEIHKHSAVTGAPTTYPRRGRGRPEWVFPKDSKFKDRPRRHVVLRFDELVHGPLILGAGRYHGFGLCLPLVRGE